MTRPSIQTQADALARAIDLLDELATADLGDLPMALAAALDTLRAMAAAETNDEATTFWRLP